MTARMHCTLSRPKLHLVCLLNSGGEYISQQSSWLAETKFVLISVIYLYKTFFLIESRYITPVCKDHKTTGMLELVMQIIANLQRGAHNPECYQSTKPCLQSPFQLDFEKRIVDKKVKNTNTKYPKYSIFFHYGCGGTGTCTVFRVVKTDRPISEHINAT